MAHSQLPIQEEDVKTMKKIAEINTKQIKQIQSLASRIWPIVYSEIIPDEQIEYMLKMMYSAAKIQEDMDRGVLYYILSKDNKDIGYIAIEPNTPISGVLRLHKLYLDPHYHRQGLGKHMLNTIELIAKGLHLDAIELNVNRFNSAVKVYQKQGYEILYSENVPIGNGFLMEDYVMKKRII